MVVYLVAIVIANLTIVQFGPTAAIYNAFFLIGLDLTTRDILHERWQKGRWWKMLILIAVGSVLSWVLNRDAGPVALASFFAFLGAGLVDYLVYSTIGNETRLFKINVSNIVSATVDSQIFGLWLAFPFSIIGGQIVAKTLGGFLWSLLLVLLVRDKSV